MARTEEVTLDSSVIVSAFVKEDKFRSAALHVMEKVFNGKYQVVTSGIVPVEVCGAISRRAGVEKAIAVKRELDKWEDMNFITYKELDTSRRREAVEIAVKTRLKGMDAIVVQVAKEKKAVLITFDEKMAEKAEATIKVLTEKDFKK